MGSREIGSIMATDSMSENVAEMSICSEPILFHYGGWDANFSGGQNGDFVRNPNVAHQNEFADSPHYPVMLENQAPFPSFEAGEFSEDGALGSLLNGKKKRKSLEVEKHKDHECLGTCELPKGDEKTNIMPISRNNKQAAAAAAEGKASSNGEGPCKEDYILVRAKRGQATNSHSLAERVRREKISERMKLLQDLVPGCNKITGKAVMLDEIINYVQSLQQQVEFLSMKLATVNPDINVDIEHLLSKDLLLHPQGGNAIGPGLSSSHAFLRGFLHGPINGFQGAPPPFHPLPSKLWNNELQSILQVGFDSNPSSLSLSGSNGLSKMEM